MGVTLTLNDRTHELARQEVLRLAARDLRSASEQLEELAKRNLAGSIPSSRRCGGRARTGARELGSR
jgi:hypothetical protein